MHKYIFIYVYMMCVGLKMVRVPFKCGIRMEKQVFFKHSVLQIEVAYFLTNPFDQVLASLSFGRWVAMALVIESLNTSLDFF